ncbi:MAG TPA: glycosyltransferase [Candidatus Hydrogenedens sp.]|nr:glycosyltransferase [Candidatus Hydrogenedens sp.]HOL20800.1 glycosyltransferase [Candidatus Hydrogenedens sp.]HPP57967.1 glycosyltransferase [Candidatus Hydrogenedens sp.]
MSQEFEITKKMRTKRGFIFQYNRFNEIIPLEDLKKWARVNYDSFKVDKTDFFSGSHEDIGNIKNLLQFINDIIQCNVSWGTNLTEPPKNIENLKNFNLLDIFLIATNLSLDQLKNWAHIGNELNIPIRLYCVYPFPFNLNSSEEDIIEVLKTFASITFVHKYPFINNKNIEINQETIKDWAKISKTFYHSNVPVNILGIPYCLVEPQLFPAIINTQQYFSDTEFYLQSSFELAQLLWNFKASKIRKILEMKIREKTSFHSGIDQLVLPWILNHPGLYVPLWAWHKLTRHWESKKKPQPLPENTTLLEQKILELQKQKEKEWGTKCASCSLRYVCDKGKNNFIKLIFTPKPIDGDIIRDPLIFRKSPPYYLDKVEKEHLNIYSQFQELYNNAIQIMLHEKPWKEVQPEDYEIENHMTHYMPGAVRWFSFSRNELQSTPLCRTEPPLTISVTFGGGFAEQIGFSFGPHIKLVCPMIAQSHKLTLHIDKDGYYILIRDNEVVAPTEFANSAFVPTRLPGILEPRISIWNIDGEIVTQGITLWKQIEEHKEERKATFSVLYVCSRYANRLKASLLSLVHQTNIKPAQIEVVIAYVPGLDATDDIINCFENTFPEIKIIRSPFNQSFWKSKGVLINSSLPLCSGDWIVLLDADIVVPPNFFAELNKVESSTLFVAPDGRKMLSPETTSKIILGLIKPWEQYEELLNSPGEWRRKEAQGIPIGFCQCCRKEVFNKITYPEFNHFEGADWFFGKSIIETFGPEHRLNNVVVLHLDHGGSQWYGSLQHR